MWRLPPLEADHEKVDEIVGAATRPRSEPQQDALVLMHVTEQLVAEARPQRYVHGALRLVRNRDGAVPLVRARGANGSRAL